MPDALLLLQITADVHAATRDTTRWPQVWKAICDWFNCPEFFRAAPPPDNSASHWQEYIRRCTDSAGQCAHAASGPCGHGPTVDGVKRQACLATVEHLVWATAGPPSSVSLRVLDTLSVPMMLCTKDCRLVFVNEAAQRELQQARWLTVRDDRLIVLNRKLEQNLAAELEHLANAENHTEAWLVGPTLEGESVNFAVQRISGQGEGAVILLSLAVYAVAPSAEYLDRLDQRLGLSPRQRELAGHLLADLSLDAAAARMNISRRTARDHLKGLFRATGTSRQGELIAHLARITVV